MRFQPDFRTWLGLLLISVFLAFPTSALANPEFPPGSPAWLPSLIPPPSWRAAGAADQAETLDSTRVDSIIRATMSQYVIPGLSACVVKNGRVAWSAVYGYADTQKLIPVESSTIFMLASISKTFVATALLQLWEQGLLGLDDDINSYLPFAVSNPNHPDDPITFRMLLCHTSSIAYNSSVWIPLITLGMDSPIPLGEFLEDYLAPDGSRYQSGNFKLYRPGEGWEYSNIAFALIAYLVERISGRSFEAYCQDSIFEPLGMPETSWFLAGLDVDRVAVPTGSGELGGFRPYGHYGIPVYPAGQLRTSGPHLARNLLAFMQDGWLDGARILKAATIDSIRTIQYPELEVGPDLQWGLGWYVIGNADEKLWGHTGGLYGVSTAMYCNLERDAGVILLTNGDGTAGHGILARVLLDFAYGLPPPPSQSPVVIDSRPNPFQDHTEIAFTLPTSASTRVSVLDVQGRHLTTLLDEVLPAGPHSCVWNGRDAAGHKLGSGLYFCRLTIGSETHIAKLARLGR